MEDVITLSSAVVVVGLALGALLLFAILIVCVLNRDCWLNQVLPCAPDYDESDEVRKGETPSREY